MVYGLIISAGNQKRYNSDIPKALVKIGDRTLLDINIENMSKCCDEVYVVCSYQNSHYFNDSDYDKIIINSGKGSGDAVMKALFKLDPVPLVDTCFIQWGDSLENADLYQDVISYYNSLKSSGIVIPCVREEKPYVQLIPDGNHVKVMFSKYNEPITSGFHDLSLFYGDADLILFKLLELAQKLNRHGEYMHKHGNELEFLDILNETNINANVMEVAYNSFSFNTIEELEQLNV